MPSNEGYQPVISHETSWAKREALIDYISTSPENINYNMLREILDAVINDEDHPYFDYYQLKNESQTEESTPAGPGFIDPGNLVPGSESQV